MSLTFVDISPVSVPLTSGIVNLHFQATADGDHLWTGVTFYWRINGGTIQSTAYNLPSPSTTINKTKQLFIFEATTVEWRVAYRYKWGIYDLEDWAPGSSSWYTVASLWDSTAPTLESLPAPTPADGSTVAPQSNKTVAFQQYATDAFWVDSIEFWIDGVLRFSDGHTNFNSLTHAGLGSYPLLRGAHSWFAKAYDHAGNVIQSPTRYFTVSNVPPTAPGTPSVEGLSQVAAGATYDVAWAAATDYNPEDTSLTYQLQEQYNGGAWSDVGTGLGLATTWTPSTVGTAALRVRANDGTADGDWATRTGITVVSTSPPNNPTLTSPSGAETWREGEIRTVIWTPASPEHPDGLSCTYEAEYSPSGAFSGDEIALFSGATGGTHALTLPFTMVDADTSTGKFRLRARDTNGRTSDWSTSAALTILQNAVPVASLVMPEAGGRIEGITPTFVFGVGDADGDPVHVAFQLSEFADFRSLVLDTDSAVDYAYWQEAADPFSSWSTMTAGGATAGNRVRYTSPVVLRYDRYYGRVKLDDGILESDWLTFSCFVVADSSIPLLITIDDINYPVVDCRVVENTGGDASPIEITIPLSLHRADPIAKGATFALAAAIGGWSRTWNGRVEQRKFDIDTLTISALQDDAYLSRKTVPSNYASADIGANLAAMVDDHGAPLQNDGINTSTGATAAIAGQYKFLREHLADAKQVLPDYIEYVDSEGIVHFEDQDDYDDPLFELYEEDPSA